MWMHKRSEDQLQRAGGAQARGEGGSSSVVEGGEVLVQTQQTQQAGPG